ncbi:hypothetical protein AeRB84_016636, partial [Aphanomyces euteiches]
MLTLFCVVVGEGKPFSIDIDAGKTVDHLKDKIEEKNKNTITCDAKDLQLYLAKNGLSRDEAKAATLDEDGEIPGCFKMDELLKIQHKNHFGMNFQPEEGKIYVLVSAPRQLLAESARVEDKLWLVCGSITNASSIKGVRCRLYRLAGTFLGYYDPARTGKDSALWYEDKTLRIHILFKTEENALRFDNALQEEPVTLGSPLNGQQLRRIYFMHYVPQESESPQDTISSISLTSSVTVVDPSTEEFCYQRIEDDRYFLP